MNRSLPSILLAALLASSACATSQGQGTLARIKETGTITMGYRDSSPPFSFVGSDQQPAGYSIDLCKRVATTVQQSLGLASLQTKWVRVTPENRIQAVASGTIDLECGSTTNTLSRQEQVDFSDLTFVDGGSILVTIASGVRSLADLGGKRIAVIPGTTTEKALVDALRKAQVNAQILSVKEHAEGIAALEKGLAQAYASDRVLLIGLGVGSKERSNLALVDEYFSYEPYGLMLRRDDPAFRLAVNRTLASLYRSGEIAPIYDKWFAALGRPSTLLQAMYLLYGLPE